MALKRKLDSSEDVYPINTKQIKLIPFPSASDDDVTMSDAPMYELEAYHTRLSSTASSNSSYSPAISPSTYPTLELYPEMNSTDFVSSSPITSSLGLLQPKGPMSTSSHQHCTQIPKLRVACSSGPHGQRMMYTLCEQCGCIEMVD